MANILLADDDRPLSTVLTRWLKKEGHSVVHVEDGLAARDYLKYSSFDLMILDWTMPGLSGIDLLHAYRAAGGAVPVLMLTGKNSIEEKLEGLGEGADDYLTKPFDGRELILRVKALLRRAPAVQGDNPSYAGLELIAASNAVKVNGTITALTAKEFALLDFLMRRKNQIIPYDVILSSVWRDDLNSSPEALTACIKRLRRKIDTKGTPSVIRNSHGIGYGLFGSTD